MQSKPETPQFRRILQDTIDSSKFIAIFMGLLPTVFIPCRNSKNRSVRSFSDAPCASRHSFSVNDFPQRCLCRACQPGLARRPVPPPRPTRRPSPYGGSRGLGKSRFCLRPVQLGGEKVPLRFEHFDIARVPVQIRITEKLSKGGGIEWVSDRNRRVQIKLTFQGCD